MRCPRYSTTCKSTMYVIQLGAQHFSICAGVHYVLIYFQEKHVEHYTFPGIVSVLIKYTIQNKHEQYGLHMTICVAHILCRHLYVEGVYSNTNTFIRKSVTRD